MRTVLRHLRQHWRALLGTFVTATIARLLSLADPQILRVIIDRYVMQMTTMDRPTFLRGVLVLIAAAGLVGILSRVFRTLQEYSISVIARRVGARLFAKSVAHSLLLPFRTFESRRSGELLHIIQRARTEAESGIGGAVRLYLGAFAILAVTIYAFTVHPLAGLLHLIGLPIVGAGMLLLSTPIRRRQREITRETAVLAGSTTEAMRNVELVKSLGVENQEIGRIRDVNDRILGLEEAKLRLVRRFTLIEGLFFHGLRASMLVVLLWLTYRRDITTGEFLTMFLYTGMIFQPLSEASGALAKYQETRATFDTLDDVLDMPQERRDKGMIDPGVVREVAFDDVSMVYDPAHPPALQNVSIALRAGQTIAFAGPSGAGKSSVVKLLVGLYSPTAGALRINGVDLREIDLDALRGRVGLVTQETQLFAGTIRDNLQIARPDATDAECLHVLEQAAATQILTRGGEGLETRIGEGGLRLSGGERQRIAIARALLRHPDVLVFDEATSSLDSVTEQAITATIRGLSATSRLTVLVAHRLSTIAHADRIHVLDGGRIVETGTHDELLASGGLYASLWQQQSGAIAHAR